MSKVERVIFILILLALVALVIMEVRKHTIAPSAASENQSTASDQSNDYVSAGAGGPSYLTYNTPGQYLVGPPLQNYAPTNIAPNMMAGKTCTICAPFQSQAGG